MQFSIISNVPPSMKATEPILNMRLQGPLLVFFLISKPNHEIQNKVYVTGYINKSA